MKTPAPAITPDVATPRAPAATPALATPPTLVTPPALATPSPLAATARLAGLLYLIPTFAGPFSMMYVPSAILAPGDAHATAERLLASERLFRLGMVSDVIIVLAEVALSALLLTLLRPAGRSLARAAAFARLAMAAVQAVNLLPQLLALSLVRGDGGLATMGGPEREALALAMLNLHGAGAHVWEALFGLHCLLVGALILRSSHVPRAFGALVGLAGIGYSVNAFGHLLAPSHAPIYTAIVAVGALVGEVPFVVWLVRGRLSSRTPTGTLAAPGDAGSGTAADGVEPVAAP